MVRSDAVLEAFTDLAPRYEETMDRELGRYLGLGYDEFAEVLVGAADVQEGESVLDLATGTALIPRKIAAQVGDVGSVVGLDITPAMLLEGGRRIEAIGSSLPIRLVCASAMALPLVEGVFDVVMCGFGAHHMDPPTMLAEVRRVLKPGGRLILVAVGAPRFWRASWAKALLRMALAVTAHIYLNARIQSEVEAISNVLTAGEWQAALSEAGLERIAIAESPARYRWYPCALTVRAVAGGS
jgi:ubiquinone/menaquinone biosynthesis C-methylase UbiE